MNPVTHEQEFLQYQISRLIEQQGRTNELLVQLLGKLKEQKEEVVNETVKRRSRSKKDSE